MHEYQKEEMQMTCTMTYVENNPRHLLNMINMNTFICLIAALLVAMSACEGADGPIVGGSAADSKTPAEWLAVVNTEDAQRLKYEAAHPDETQLLLGACWANEIYWNGNFQFPP
jgi:hypothetical protein